METRKSIGERMLERLDRNDRFSRFARLNTGFRLGSYLFPDEVTAIPEQRGTGEVTHLSSAPYWERIHRLGNARLRRQQRLAALSERANRVRQVSAIRRMPSLKPRTIPFFGLSSVIASDFEVLAPLPTAPEESSLVEQSVAGPAAASPWVGAQRASSPWHTSEFRAAKVATRSSEPSRPLERAVERAPASSAVVERVRKSIASAEPVRRASLKGPTDLVEPTANDSRMARRARQSLRRSSSPARVAAVDYEAALPDDFLPPTRHAQGRIAAKRSTRRGLRSALSSSPLMAALEPGSTTRVDADGPVQPPVRTRRLGTVGQTASRRVSHRQQEKGQALLSASPIQTPATVSPSALTSSPSRTHIHGEVVDGGIESEATGSGRTPRSSPMVQAMKRAESPVEPLHERPLSERAPVAARPVKTRSGVFAPESTVLVPGVVPEEATPDAAPAVAEARAKRRSQTANAVQRSAVSGVLPLNEPATEAGPSQDRGHQAEAGVAVASARTRPHRVTRTASGSYVPEAEVLAPLQRASERLQTASESKASAKIEPDAPIEPKAAERIDQVTRTASGIRRISGVASVGDAEVLAPVIAPSTDPQELQQGQHAAERARQSPVVGESVRKVLKQSDAQTVREATVRPVSGGGRQVAPKLFRSPLSHIQVRQSQPSRIRPASGSITLKASSEHSVSENAGFRESKQAALGQVQQAWERSGRPLDWTSARIEVIQVPATGPSSAEPARSRRTMGGAYVPAARQAVNQPVASRPGLGESGGARARTRIAGSTRTMAPEVDSGVVLARPETAAPISDAPTSGAPGPMDPTQPDTMTAPPAGRAGFDATMGGLGSGQVGPSMPIWAQRSTGRPRITGGDDLVQQLARASAPDEVVSVLMDQSDTVRRATSSLPTPVVQVIQQIKTEAVRAEGEAQAAERSAVQSETVRRRSQRREGVRSTTRVVRGMTGLNPRGGSARAPSAAADRVSKLAKRLQELIAMAENQNRSGARQQVRMAEDSGAARAEGQSAPTSAGDGGDASADIDTLAREVTEQVTRELEMRRERRQEDPDGRSIWW